MLYLLFTLIFVSNTCTLRKDLSSTFYRTIFVSFIYTIYIIYTNYFLIIISTDIALYLNLLVLNYIIIIFIGIMYLLFNEILQLICCYSRKVYTKLYIYCINIRLNSSPTKIKIFIIKFSVGLFIWYLAVFSYIWKYITELFSSLNIPELYLVLLLSKPLSLFILSLIIFILHLVINIIFIKEVRFNLLSFTFSEIKKRFNIRYLLFKILIICFYIIGGHTFVFDVESMLPHIISKPDPIDHFYKRWDFYNEEIQKISTKIEENLRKSHLENELRNDATSFEEKQIHTRRLLILTEKNKELIRYLQLCEERCNNYNNKIEETR